MTAEFFSHLIGNDSIKIQLQRMIEKQAIANSFLFAGADGIGKSLFAQALATALICQDDPEGIHQKKIKQGNHPDIHHYRPEGKLGLHSIQSMRQLSEQVYMPAYEAQWKVFIVHDADRMLSYSANALLKTFEEPPARTVIILISHNMGSMLPTILSRCRLVRFQAIARQQIEDFLMERAPEKGRLIAELANGSLGRAIHLLEEGEHPGRELIFKALSQESLDYKSITKLVDVLAEQIEAGKKQAEVAAKEDLYKMPVENFSALQQQALEKELEGAVAMSQTQSVYALFDQVLSWYRDLHVLLLAGRREYLMNPDYESDLEQAVQRGNLLPLEHVQKTIEEARLAVQRSVSLSITLESLFLKLF